MLTSELGVVIALINSQEPQLLNTKSNQSTFHHGLGNGSCGSRAEELLAVDDYLMSHFSSGMWHMEWVAHTLDDFMLIWIWVLLIRLSGL